MMLAIDYHEPLTGQVEQLMQNKNLDKKSKIDLCKLILKRMNCFGKMPVPNESAFCDNLDAVFQLKTFTIAEFAESIRFSSASDEEIQGWCEGTCAPVRNERRTIIGCAVDLALKKLQASD